MKKLLAALTLAAALNLTAETVTNNPAHKLRIVLVGDSTVTDKSGWGLGFKQFLKPDTECVNAALGGRSSKSYLKENRWQPALDLHGDYYLIQFGHNDEPGKGDRTTDPATTFYTNMVRYVDEARAIGAKPVLITSLTRRQWAKGSTNKINSSLVPYVEVVKKIAAEKNVPLVDLHARSRELCESLGKDALVAYSPVKNDNGTNVVDGTHLNARGSTLFARLVVEELRKNVPELAPHLLADPVVPPLPKVFDVKKYGAKGDGKTFDTAAIQAALDDCGLAGGGIVRLASGRFLSRPVFLRSHVTLQIDKGATLQASDNFADFTNTNKPGAVWAFVNGSNLNDVTISGGGTIDGAGAKWWPGVKEAKKSGEHEARHRPRLVLISSCVGLRVKDVTLQNSPSFHLVPVDCEDVEFAGLTIHAPADSPNTDAIDPSETRHLTISNCTIDVGDDNIAIKSGHEDSAHPQAACEDITVENCTFLHGHGMSIGSETRGGVKGLVVKNCTFTGTTSGIRIKSDRSRGGPVEDCVYKDLKMMDVKIPINITCYYPKVPKEDSAQAVTNLTPSFRDIKISNVTATSPESVGVIVGLPESVVSNITFENVSITAPKGLTVRNAKAIRFDKSALKIADGVPLILETNAEVGGLAAP